jgi:hypothetical protein
LHPVEHRYVRQDGELYVVPSERHVERLAREGKQAETLTSLRSRLAAALLPELAFADRRECRLVLGMALEGAEASGPGQLGLFGGVVPEAAPRTAPAEARADPLLAAVRARGGASWARLIAALDDAIGVLRARGGTIEHLDRVGKSKGFLGTRARTLAAAMRALDARLAAAGARDERLTAALVAEAIVNAEASRVEEILRYRRLRGRWLLAWEPCDLAWWRALDDKLVPRGGGARVVLPTFDRPLAGNRERDPLDALADEVARGLDAPAESETIEPVLGDLTGADGGDGTLGGDPERVELVSASDAVAQARAAAAAVVRALKGGAAMERIAIAFPVLDERARGPLRRALEEEGIVAYESRGAPPSQAPVIAGALLALDAATSLDRHTVARLLRSGWLDAPRLTGEDRRDAERRIARIARTLESFATAAGEDAAARLLRTATTRTPGRASRANDEEDERERDRDVTLATQLVAMLSRTLKATTRIQQVQAARSLWTDLGIGARAGRGGLASFTSDAVPTGVARASRLAIARDARAWDALVSALDLYETTAHRVGARDQIIDALGFRLELVELLDTGATQPAAGRAAAVRIATLADVAGDALDLLVVLDANEGLLPRDDAQDALVSDSLAEAIATVSRGAFVAPAKGARRARELTALALAAAEAKHVLLAFAREDGAGAPLGPSAVVDALERAGVPVLTTEPEPPRRSGADVRVRVARERERESFFLDPARPRSDVVGDLAPGQEAARLLVAETGGAERALAVTGLERFARCAFMGYAQVVLATRATDMKGELPDAREEGTLIHEALAAAFLATRELWARRPRATAEIFERGEAAAGEVLERWQGHAPLRSVIRLRVRDAVRAVLRVALEDETWDFSLAEQTFGARSEGAWPALVLADDDQRLSLRGSIDRIDRAHDGRALRVIDYKRSKTTVQASTSSLGETALQVPLYACVASRQIGLVATGAYAPTQARDVGPASKVIAKVAARMDELVDRAASNPLAEIEKRALSIVASARSGTLVPIPASESECRLCEFSGGCRKPRFAMAAAEEYDEDA